MITVRSHCKVNLLLNILGKRADGFHELETLMHPVALFDEVQFDTGPSGIHLECSSEELPTDSGNLVFRAAQRSFEAARLAPAVNIRLQKNLPLAAGMGGGSANAAATLRALNRLHGSPLSEAQLGEVAAAAGSDVPFFLQDFPALAFGRGENIEPVGGLQSLKNAAFIIVHPGFGISTPWAYTALARYPQALNGRPGRARELVTLLQTGSFRDAGSALYNSLEAPALEKYPILGIFQEFFRDHGAPSMMSGSGSSTFAICESLSAANLLAGEFRKKFGDSSWLAIAPCAASVGSAL